MAALYNYPSRQRFHGWQLSLARYKTLPAGEDAAFIGGVRVPTWMTAGNKEQTDNAFALFAKAREIEYNGLTLDTHNQYNALIMKVHGVHPGLIPMDSMDKVMIYFTTLAGGQWSQVERAKAAIAYWHKMHKIEAPLLRVDFPPLSMFWRGLRKSCVNVVKGKAPITNEQFSTLLLHWLRKGTVSGLRNAFVACLQYYAMRRISEVLTLTRDRLTDKGEGQGILLFINRMKNDQYGRGHHVLLPEATNNGVPLARIIRTMLAKTPATGSLLPASHRWRPNEWDTPIRPFTADAWRRAIQDALKACNLDIKDASISSHSFRKGGCTRAVQLNVPQDVIMDIAGWNDPATMLAYGKRSLEERRAFIQQM